MGHLLLGIIYFFVGLFALIIMFYGAILYTIIKMYTNCNYKPKHLKATTNTV